MNIVHLYPPHRPELAQYVTLLTELPGTLCEATDEVKTFLDICGANTPDIIHLHGCSQNEYIRAALLVRQQGARIVLTPHGELEPWERNVRMKQPGRLKELVRDAFCVIVRSPIEEEMFQQLAWNSRVRIIRNPLLTQTTDKATCQQLYLEVYQQVMDSFVLEKFSSDTLHAMRTLLKVGINEDSRWGEPFDVDRVDWHRLIIYGQQEGILSYLERGCLLMGIRLPETAIAPSYLPNDYEAPTPISGKTIPEMVAIIKHQAQEGSLPLLSLANLHYALRQDDVKDDRLMEQLKEEHLKSFFAALLPVMDEQTGLDEGYMPCPPVDNNETKRIRTTIQKHLEI